MIAELLGWISAPRAFPKTSVVHDRWSLWRAHPAPVQCPRRRGVSRIALRGSRGFSLTEITVASAIVGVLSTIATPFLTSMIAAQRLKTATFDLYAALTYARSEAIKRNSVVTITPRDGNFANGYDLDADGVVLRSRPGNSAVTIDAPSGISLAFSGYGRLTTSGSYQLELSPAQESGPPKRCLIISPTGRPSIRMDNDHDGNCING